MRGTKGSGVLRRGFGTPGRFPISMPRCGMASLGLLLANEGSRFCFLVMEK
jgi:hypothetical protein